MFYVQNIVAFIASSLVTPAKLSHPPFEKLSKIIMKSTWTPQLCRHRPTLQRDAVNVPMWGFRCTGRSSCPCRCTPRWAGHSCRPPPRPAPAGRPGSPGPLARRRCWPMGRWRHRTGQSARGPGSPSPGRRHRVSTVEWGITGVGTVWRTWTFANTTQDMISWG